jgi:hypothetical protein
MTETPSQAIDRIVAEHAGEIVKYMNDDVMLTTLMKRVAVQAYGDASLTVINLVIDAIVWDGV